MATAASAGRAVAAGAVLGHRIRAVEAQPSCVGGGGSGRPSFFAKNVSRMCCAIGAAFAAVIAVLDEDDAGNLRVVARREEHEPAVVAQVLVGLAAAAAVPWFEMTCAVPVLPDTSSPVDARACRRCRRR